MRLHRLVLALAVVALAAPAHAADPVPDSSLKLIPADASFYSTSLRLGEQMDQFFKSNAYARLRALPAAKLAVDQFKEAAGKPDNPVGQMMQMLKEPANKQLFELLKDLPRQEMFIYGGPTWAKLIPIALDANWAMQFAPAKALISSQDPGKASGRAVLQVLNAAADKIQFPELVIGFKVSKPAAAVAQIGRLEAFLMQVTADNKELKGRVKRTKVAGVDALTVSVDGSMVPLDQIPWKELEEHDGQFQKLRVRLKTLTLTVSLLVKDNYLLLTVGPHAGVAETLGQGPGLASRPEMAPVLKFADRKPVAISYMSKALAAGSSTNGENMLGMLDMIKDGLDKLGLTEKRRLAIDKDLKRLVNEVFASLPKPGATVAVSFLSDRGQESYVYNYGTSPDAATPKPLTVLNHLGGAPLIAIAGQLNDPTPGYRYFAGWIKTVYGHVDGAAKELLEQRGLEEQYKQVQQGMEQVLPYLRKFDDITGNQLMPALGEGEMAFVVDGKWTSKKWFEGFDQHGQDLPLLEIGIVRTVKDSPKLLKSFQSYRDLINEVMAKARQLGAPLPEDGLPKPESKNIAGATVYYWPLPPVGQDKQILPNFGISDNLIVFSLSTKHSERLLTSTPLTVDGGPLSSKKPAISGAVVDFGGFVGAIRPWIEDFALPMMLQQMPDKAPPGLGKKDLPAQVKTVLDVLGCLRTFTSLTYKDGEATVTHSEMVIRDLK